MHGTLVNGNGNVSKMKYCIKTQQKEAFLYLGFIHSN